MLTEKVRRRPYCVVLLDELEKASAAGDNTEEETERTARIKALLFAISL